MTKKDFELIAAALSSAAPLDTARFGHCAAEHAQHRHTVEEFARRLALTNPRFNHARFLAAAGVKP